LQESICGYVRFVDMCFNRVYILFRQSIWNGSLLKQANNQSGGVYE